MTKKKILSLLLALIIVFSTVSPSYASLYDYYYREKTENNKRDYSVFRLFEDEDLIFDIFEYIEDYFQEGYDEKYYLALDISKYLANNKKADTKEIYENIDAYIKTDGYSLIDKSLDLNKSEFEENYYTKDSWAAYEAARADLLTIKELRFVKETIVLEKISALELAYKNLVPDINTKELERKLAEAKSYNLRDYTQKTADALSQAIKEAEYLLSSDRITEKAVQIAIKDLDKKIKALEKNYDLYPVEVLAIPDQNLELGQELNLPQTVIVKMSDNSHVERRVGWNTREVFVNTPGRYEASTSVYFYNPDSYETAKRYNFDISITINVLNDLTTDKTGLVKAIENGQAFSPNKYSEYSYRDLREALERGLAVNNNINSSQGQIDQAEQDIIDAIARLKEEQPKDRIIYVIQPERLTLKQGDAFVMPKTVKVVLNSGVEVEKPVTWSQILTTEELGEFTAYGTIEGTNEKARLVVQVLAGQKQADISKLEELVKEAKSLDTTNKTPASIKKLESEITSAENVLALANPSQELIDNAYGDLEKAIKALEDKPTPADLTIVQPSENLEVSPGQEVQIEVKAPSGGQVGYKIALDGSFNTVPIDANMRETEPGTYTASWTVPQGLNASNLKVFVSHTDESGFTSFAETEGIISIVQKLTVTYNIDGKETVETVDRGKTPTETPKSEKKGYEIKWTNENRDLVDPSTIEIHENTRFYGSDEEIPGAWFDLVFKLPRGLEFVQGEKTLYRVFKDQTLQEQKVKFPEVDPINIPAGQKIHWDLDLNQAIDKDTEIRATLVKDDSQYTIFNLVVGENGSLKKADEGTLEVLTEKTDEEIKSQAEDKVEANDYYQIGEITVDRETEEIKINFVKDPNYWVDVIFIDQDGNERDKHHVHIGQTFADAKINPPDIKVEEGKKVIWDPVFLAENLIEKPAGSNEIVFTASVEKDDTAFEKYSIILDIKNGKGSYIDENNKTLEILKTASDDKIEEEAKKLVTADDNYKISNVTINKEAKEITITFAKDETKWIDITITKTENGNIKLDGAVKESITLSVPIGTKLSDLMTEGTTEFFVQAEGHTNYLWNKVDHVFDQENKDFTFEFSKDPSRWKDVKFLVGDNGSFKDTDETEIIINKAIGTDLTTDTEIPEVVANDEYRFTGWTPKLPNSITAEMTAENLTFTAIYESTIDLKYTVRLVQVDDNGNPYTKDEAGEEIITIKADQVKEGKKLGDTVTVSAPKLKNFDLAPREENEKTLTIDRNNDKNIIEFRYKVKDESAKKIQDQVAADAEVKVPNVESQVEGISFDFDKKKRIVYFNFENPGGNAIQDLMASLTGSGIFPTIASLEGIQKVSFGNTSIEFYDKNGNKKDANAIKNEMVDNAEQIMAAFGLDADVLQNILDGGKYSITANWHGINAKPVAEELGQVSEETIVTEDTYTFMFNVTDRKVVFNADGKGTFAFEEKTLPYRKALGAENIPEFTPGANYKFTGSYLVSYIEYADEGTKIVNKEITKDQLAQMPVEDQMVIKPEVEELVTVSYEFKSADETLTLPEEVTKLVPQGKTAKVGTRVTAENPTATSVVTPLGTWEFVGYDKTEVESIETDTTFVGTWTFTANPKYKASYKFVSADTKELPEAINAYKPEDTAEYEEGATVTAKAPTETTYKVEDGTWTFTSWDEETKTVSGSDISFVGTWKFTANPKYKVTYKFVSADTKELPQAINAYKPTDETEYEEGATATAKAPTETTYKAEDGTWEFTSWDAETKTVNGSDVSFVGTWKFTEEKIKITYKVDEKMGTLSLTEEEVSPTTGEIQGSTATANEGYAFVNWTDEEGNEVNKEAKFVPTDQKDAVYTANFGKIVTLGFLSTESGFPVPMTDVEKIPTKYIIQKDNSGEYNLNIGIDKAEINKLIPKGYIPTEGPFKDSNKYEVSKDHTIMLIVDKLPDLTVTFDTSEGLPVPEKQTVIPGDSVEKPAKDPVKEGSVFIHWVDENGQEVKFPYTPKKDTTLKAIYERELVEGYVIGDENYDNYSVVNIEYKDNGMKYYDLKSVPIYKDGTEVSAETTFEFYTDSSKEKPLNSLDLPNGGTTKKLYVVAKHKEETIEKDIYIKFGSVTIGKDSLTLMTIEDALAQAKDKNQIVVKYNTTFASSDIADSLYDGSTHEVKRGVTVLLPFDETYSDDLKNKDSEQNGEPITRNKAFVELNLPENISLDIKGTLTLNAKTSGGTFYGSGFVYKNFYSQVKMEKGSKITVNDGGVLNSIGFIYGEGSIETMAGSKVLDLMMIHDFRGGTRTKNIYREVFPFNQFSVNNIEVPIKINAGTNYSALSHITVGGFFGTTHAISEINILGNADSLIEIKNGYINKSYNINTGKMIFDVYGDIALNNIKISAYVSVSTQGKDIPLSGFFEINIREKSTLDINASVKMLPGSKIQVDQEATMNINQDGKIFVYKPADLNPGIPTSSNPYDAYPIKKHSKTSGFERKYRVAPKADFTEKANGNLIINGKLNVLGAIGGPVVQGANGIISVDPSASTRVTIKEIIQKGDLPEHTLDLEIIGNQVNP